MRVGIVGGGLTGMVLAQKYATDGHEVTVVEYADRVGGLSTWSDFGGFDWDSFNREILADDSNLLAFLAELNMSDQIEWCAARCGFFTNNKLHTINGKAEFIKSPLLSLGSKVRHGLTLLWAPRKNSLKPAETTTAEAWLRKNYGDEAYDKVWESLLKKRFGSSHIRLSAVFIESYIKRMLAVYEESVSKGQVGHIRGGYKSIFRSLQKSIKSSGGRILLNETVLRISTGDNGVSVHTPQRLLTFDEVICTSTANVAERIIDDDLLAADRNREQAEYQSEVSVALLTRKPITDHYVVNVADENIPFASLIAVSNGLPSENFNGYHLTILPHYLSSADTGLEKPDSFFSDACLAGVKRLFPDFSKDDVVNMVVHRAINAQPLQIVNTAKAALSTSTSDPRLHIVNAGQIVDVALSNNEIIGSVNQFYDNRFRASARNTAA